MAEREEESEEQMHHNIDQEGDIHDDEDEAHASSSEQFPHLVNRKNSPESAERLDKSRLERCVFFNVITECDLSGDRAAAQKDAEHSAEQEQALPGEERDKLKLQEKGLKRG